MIMCLTQGSNCRRWDSTARFRMLCDAPGFRILERFIISRVSWVPLYRISYLNARA